MAEICLKFDGTGRTSQFNTSINSKLQHPPSPPPLRQPLGIWTFENCFVQIPVRLGQNCAPPRVPNLMINHFEKTKSATVTCSIQVPSFKTWTFLKFSSKPCPSESELLTSNWNTSMVKINTCAPLGSWLDRLDTSSSNNSSPQLGKVQIVHPRARTTDPCIVRRGRRMLKLLIDRRIIQT